jgi:hypothetical protein
MAMYWYGYKYPKVQRNFEALYSDPEYQYKWARAAILNRGVAARIPWIKFLKQNHYLGQVAQILRQAGQEYRALYGVSEKNKTAARRRKNKLEKALAAVQNPGIQTRLREEYGNKYSDEYVNSVVATLQRELDHIKNLLEWQAPGPQPRPPGYVELQGQG